jgi:GH24 family phage-related lysozyme (muramidase)
MKTSPRGVQLIKSHEVFVPWTYDDLATPSRRVPSGHRVAPPYTGGPVKGTLTIGYGHTAAAGDPIPVAGMDITEDEAEKILRRDLAKFEQAVNRMVTVELTQNQFDALVSFVFNVGPGAFQRSTLLRHVNARRFDRVPAAFMQWTRSKGRELPGLVKRRRDEVALWRDLPRESVEAAPVQTIDEPERITPGRDRESRAALGIAGLGGIGGAATVVRDVADAGDAVSGLGHVITSPVFLILLATACLAGLIWWWRKQRIEEYGE